MTVLTKRQRRLKRRRRVRARVNGTAERPRLSVYRSNRGVFAQLIDDTKGHTVAAVNWIEPELRKLTATEQATKAWTRALELNPDNEVVRNNLQIVQHGQA